MPFKVTNAEYFSWFASEKEKGTTIEILLEEVSANVKFDSLIFRKMMLPVQVSGDAGGVRTIIAVYPFEESRFLAKKRLVNKPNQFIFHHNGKREVYYLTDIKRKEMVYY